MCNRNAAILIKGNSCVIRTKGPRGGIALKHRRHTQYYIIALSYITDPNYSVNIIIINGSNSNSLVVVCHLVRINCRHHLFKSLLVLRKYFPWMHTEMIFSLEILDNEGLPILCRNDNRLKLSMITRNRGCSFTNRIRMQIWSLQIEFFEEVWYVGTCRKCLLVCAVNMTIIIFISFVALKPPLLIAQ